MEQLKGRTWKQKTRLKRIWGLLGALWLVMICLGGCVVPISGDNESSEIQNIGVTQANQRESIYTETKPQEASEYDSKIESSIDTEENEVYKEPDSSQKAIENSQTIEESKSSGESQKEKSKETDNSKDSEDSQETENSKGEKPGNNSEDITKENTNKETIHIDDIKNTELITEQEIEPQESLELSVEESGVYSTKDEVALYLHLYGHLPENYITKQEAEQLGWNSKEGNLWEVAPGKSIGGNRFGNYEGLLPNKKGRKYFECDIDFEGGYRGAKRLIYSSDGLIYYTEDHYNTFEQLYGE